MLNFAIDETYEDEVRSVKTDPTLNMDQLMAGLKPAKVFLNHQTWFFQGVCQLLDLHLFVRSSKTAMAILFLIILSNRKLRNLNLYISLY